VSRGRPGRFRWVLIGYEMTLLAEAAGAVLTPVPAD